MEKYLVCFTQVGYNPELGQARRLSEEEKTHYTPRFQDIGFVGIGENLELEHLNQLEVEKILQREKSDGQFINSSGSVYIISQDEWDKLLELENSKKELADQVEKNQKIAELQEIIHQCEKVEKLYTNEEAVEKRKQYNNLYNEGGYGYIPHFFTINEYEDAKNKLLKLLCSMVIGRYKKECSDKEMDKTSEENLCHSIQDVLEHDGYDAALKYVRSAKLW